MKTKIYSAAEIEAAAGILYLRCSSRYKPVWIVKHPTYKAYEDLDDRLDPIAYVEEVIHALNEVRNGS